MKSFYQRVQTQYQKLQAKINKALESGRFYEFSKFKQERLWARLQRCRLQLKHLATGAAVAAALLMSAPSAMAQQYPPPFLPNSFARADYSVPAQSANRMRQGDFVDLDNDGDLDFASGGNGGSKTIEYFENIGTVDSANFVQRTGTDNPFDGLNNALDVTFVDIDGDGDMDCFARAYYYNVQNQGIFYIENQGTATTPNFTLQTQANNPLSDVGTYYGTGANAVASFVDIDNDGDMDCFISGYDYYNPSSNDKIVYYINQGTATSPNFARQNSTLNPFDNYVSLIPDRRVIRMEFIDMDKDGDLDALWTASEDLFSNSTDKSRYYENTGTAASPIFSMNNPPAVSPFDNINLWKNLRSINLIDDQNDGDLDVVTAGGFYENTLYTGIDKVFMPNTEHLEKVVASPNPASSWLQFDQPITGIIGIYDQTGRLITQRELELANGLDLSDLSNGLYFFYWRDETRTLQEKVQVQH